MRFLAGEALEQAGIDPERIRVALPTLDPRQIQVREASSWFMRLWSKGITAVAMPWAIYLHPERMRRAPDELGRLVVHELTHIDQWRRLGPLGWARAYLGDYLRGRRAGLGHHGAYRAIGLEQEARDVARRIGG